MIADPPLKMDSGEQNILSSSFGISSENQSNEVISNMVLTHTLKRWEEIKTQLHPISYAVYPSGHILLKFCLIILKYNHFSDISSQI